MEAKQFYVCEAEQATPIVLIAQKQFETSQFSKKMRRDFTLQQFNGKLGECAIIADAQGQLLKAYVGTGEGRTSTALAQAALKLPSGIYTLKTKCSNELMVSWALAQYHFDTYKKKDRPINRLSLPRTVYTEVLEEAQAIFLVRDLVNMPANELTPSVLATLVEDLAKRYNGKCLSIKGEALLKKGFPAIHTVGRAAECEPHLITLTWGNPAHPKVALVGKGVCFDSGGLDLKPAQGMRLMKKDMGGAAHVVALAQWIMAENLPICLEVYIPAVENAISNCSYRPGDIISMRNGLTVEVDNTDAEGRLILGDALTYACEHNPDVIIDFATLTGASRVALGTDIAAMYTNDDTIAQQILKAASKVGESVWRMPLHDGYHSMIESNIADLVNCNPSPYAGGIIAALFLQHFITREVSWIHFDIMAWNVSSRPGRPEGGEAMGLQSVMAFLKGRFRRENRN